MARLVVDSGRHAKCYGREQANDHLIATTGVGRARSRGEIDATPSAATSPQPKIGLRSALIFENGGGFRPASLGDEPWQ
jgi:hypothetical protein